MSVDSTKVYFGYTPYIPRDVAKEWEVEASRATIAMKKEGNTILYGVSICSHDDNFVKKAGRAIAEERLNMFPQFIEIPPNLGEHTKPKLKDDHDICLYFLRNMINSLSRRDRIKRAQRRVNKGKKKAPTKPYLISQVIGTDLRGT